MSNLVFRDFFRKDDGVIRSYDLLCAGHFPMFLEYFSFLMFQTDEANSRYGLTNAGQMIHSILSDY